MENVFDKIGHYYDDLINKHGYSPMSCDYGHPESQKTKFVILSQAGSFSGKSVLDIGCGFADYADFLETRFTDVKYIGVDISDQMVARAKARRPDLEIRKVNVLQDDFVEKFDIVTANGIFYLLGNDAFSTMRNFIEKMYQLANETVVFNTLSRYAGDQQPDEFYADPSEVFTFCMTLTPWVVLRHDYHGRDFSIYMYKKRNG